MVLYFSGTGNSQLAAIQLAEVLGDNEMVSINQYLKERKKAVILSERALVFVTPTYAWRIPRIVEQWIMETDFQGSRDAYFILTCGGSCGNAAVYAEKLCAKKGLRFCGLAPIVMPENYLAMFPTPDESQCREIVEKASPCITALGEQIKCGKCLVKSKASLGERIQSGPVNPLFYSFFVHDKGFAVSDHCISCGKCALRCPLNNIELKNGRPVWNGNCTHCMACIGGCPTEAIEYKAKSKGQHRHYIMDDSLCRKK